MTNSEIREQIDANNLMIEALLDPTSFTLNVLVKDLFAKNAQLQAQCTHEFVDGVCIYCDTEEK
jgi:hypothetical protein